MNDALGQMAPEETPLYSFMPTGSSMNMVTVFKDCIEMRLDGRVIRKPIAGWFEAVNGFSDVTNGRDAARAIADPHVCDFISNESAELGGPHGWREIDEDPEGMESELSYAASRGLIERQPNYVGRFRFTDAAKEFL